MSVPSTAPTGTVTSSPAGISCPGTCTASFADGATVHLTETPSGTAFFSGWSGACSGTSNTCAVTMSAAKNVTVAYEPGEVLTLRMTRHPSCDIQQPDGVWYCLPQAHITTSPAGMTCDGFPDGEFNDPPPNPQTIDCVFRFPAGTVVSLTSDAEPIWGGACGFNTGLTCDVGWSSDDVTATADF